MGILLGLVLLAPLPVTASQPEPVACVEEQPVVLYSTAWCGWCHKARTWLTEEGHPFVERDIETEPGAAAELETKARKAGIEVLGVPVIDVGGTLVVGFDQPRLEKLLGP